MKRTKRWMLPTIPLLAGMLALGACGGEEVGGEEGVGAPEIGAEEGVIGDEGVAGEGGVVGEGVGAEGGMVGGTEILGNGIDDDADGLIDEES